MLCRSRSSSWRIVGPSLFRELGFERGCHGETNRQRFSLYRGFLHPCKSLACASLLSDESILGKQSREVQEQLAPIWIHENAELAGMRKADVESVKAHASRQVDIARAACILAVIRHRRQLEPNGCSSNNPLTRSATRNRASGI
jgi:hypothetical protein